MLFNTADLEEDEAIEKNKELEEIRLRLIKEGPPKDPIAKKIVVKEKAVKKIPKGNMAKTLPNEKVVKKIPVITKVEYENMHNTDLDIHNEEIIMSKAEAQRQENKFQKQENEFQKYKKNRMKRL